jgi:hypothetical protein
MQFKAVFLVLACIQTSVASMPIVHECEGMKIAILDVNDLAEAAGVKSCSLKDVGFNTFQQITVCCTRRESYGIIPLAA